ncbi:MAG: hypothetical protein ACD_45C00151G0009 [uncultured bacterium]|nr:MAG: hypothetical protein ACD_45C00151G0009 [uncultured bacterium]
MAKNIAKSIINDLLQTAEISINGSQPWDIQVHNEQFYQHILNQGSLGLGESYIDAWWDCAALDILFARILRANVQNHIKTNKWLALKIALAKIMNVQNKKQAFHVGKTHYDLGNDLFTSMLDSRMNYTCGYWKNAKTLDEAQLAKLELVCQKLKLEPGMRLLDIGCGWGALAKYAATKYQANVVGVTVSRNQLEYATQNCAGLPVEIRYQDYRDITGTFDRVVSLGMFEHVGHLNYRHYMQIVSNCLKDEGIFLLHTIGSNKTVFRADEWITKYIFSTGMLPSIAQIGETSEDFFIMEDWQNFGIYYDNTLMAWQQNFTRHWDTLKSHYDERFYRMWNYYLLSCAGNFRARAMQVWQIVFSKGGVNEAYQASR